jgi:hypothetical protein
VEPPGTLDFWYGQRAKQIREEYDYVIMMCSGGSDSNNALYSFLNHGHKVDEIIAGAPLSGLKNWKVNVNDKSYENIISETFLAQLPFLKLVSQSHPDIKITIHDFFEDMLNLTPDEWIYECSSHWLHAPASARNSLEKFKHIKDLAEAGKKVAVVYGIDKPILCRGKQGHISSVFYDSAVNIVTPHFKGNKYPSVESVLFYYSPDMPELLIKQAHDLCRKIYRPENLHVSALMMDHYIDLVNRERDPSVRSSNWQHSIIPFIYPSIYEYQKNVWQAEKPSGGFNNSGADYWVRELHKDTRLTQMIFSDLKSLVSQIDKRYRVEVGGKEGLKRFTHYWVIGHESRFFPENLA